MKAHLYLVLFTLGASAHGGDAKQSFAELPGPVRHLHVETLQGVPVQGAQISEKEGLRGRLCQRSAAVVPEPKYTYACFRVTAEGITAQNAYARLVDEVKVSYYSPEGEPYARVRVFQKKQGDQFCRRTATVGPQLQWKYRCYSAE